MVSILYKEKSLIRPVCQSLYPHCCLEVYLAIQFTFISFRIQFSFRIRFPFPCHPQLDQEILYLNPICTFFLARQGTTHKHGVSLLCCVVEFACHVSITYSTYVYFLDISTNYVSFVHSSSC